MSAPYLRLVRPAKEGTMATEEMTHPNMRDDRERDLLRAVDSGLLFEAIWQRRQYSPSMDEVTRVVEGLLFVDDRARYVLACRYRWPVGASYEEIGRIMSLTPERVRQIEFVTLSDLRDSIGLDAAPMDFERRVS